MHFIGPPDIRVDGDTAHCDTYCQAHHVGADTDVGLGLRYVDRFEHREGEWLIAKRVCAFDWTYTVPFDPARRPPSTPTSPWATVTAPDIGYTGVWFRLNVTG